MHPRFQELIARNNEYKARMEEQERTFQSRLKELESRIPAQQPQKDELMERLKGIDPAFAERFGKISEVDQLKQELQEFHQWRQEMADQQLKQQISSTKDKFYTENNIPEARRKIYEGQLLAMRDEGHLDNVKVSDLPKVMKQIHDEIGKLFQAVERSTTKQFVENKRTEASKPAPLKPGAPAKSVKTNGPISKEELMAEMRKNALSKLRSDSEI